MSRYLKIGSCILILIQGCVRGGSDRVYSRSEPLTDVLTLKSSFGAEDVPEDYMLADPFWEGMDVTPEGDVLVVDENWVKVFDSSGKAKTRFGGEGDGPGEFRGGRDIRVSPDGYIAVHDTYRQIHFYRPDYSFIERMHLLREDPFSRIFQSEDLTIDGMSSAFCLGEEERLFLISVHRFDRDVRNQLIGQAHREIFLIHHSADSTTVLARHMQTDSIIGGGIFMGALGWFQAAPLVGNRVVYLHPFHDSVFGPEEFTYALSILDLKTGERSKITHAFIPEEIEWEPLDYSEDWKQANPDRWKETQDLNQRAQKTIDERVWSVPVLHLQTDDRYIFAFTATNNDSGEVMADVFDADAGRYLCSVFFPYSWGNRIRNGYFYRFNDFRREENYPRVEKYRIDSRVYGRR